MSGDSHIFGGAATPACWTVSQPVFCLYLEHTRSAELVLTDNHEKEKDDN